MDRDKRCGSDDFISAAFLSVSPLTETMSLNMPHVDLSEEDGRTASWSMAKIYTIKLRFNKKVVEKSHLLDQLHIFDAFAL